MYYDGGSKPIAKSHQYSILAKFAVEYGTDVREIRNKASDEPVVFRTTGNDLTLHDLLLKNFEDGEKGLKFKVDCYHGLPTKSSQPFKTGVPVQVVDVAQYRRFDLTDYKEYEGSQFFLYGDHSNNAYLASIPVKGNGLDFYQVCFVLYRNSDESKQR